MQLIKHMTNCTCKPGHVDQGTGEIADWPKSSTIHWVNLYPPDNSIVFSFSVPYSYLSSGVLYSTFEKLEPKDQKFGDTVVVLHYCTGSLTPSHVSLS